MAADSVENLQQADFDLDNIDDYMANLVEGRNEDEELQQVGGGSKSGS